MRNSDHSFENNSKRRRSDRYSFNSLVSVINKPNPTISTSASIHIKAFGAPLISKSSGSSVDVIHLQPCELYTIGRDHRRCDFSFDNLQVSKKHCQIYFDAYSKKLFIVDGVLFSSFNKVRVSLNGVYVDGSRVRNGEIKEVREGSEVSFLCTNEGVCNSVRIGFTVERIAFMEEFIHENPPNSKYNFLFLDSKLANANLLLSKCREILSSDDPVLYIRRSFTFPSRLRAKHSSRNRVKRNSRFVPSESNIELQHCSVNGDHLQQSVNTEVPLGECNFNNKPNDIVTSKEKFIQSDQLLQQKKKVICPPPPGNKFYLNRLHFMSDDQSREVNVTLPELLYPVETLERVFIATFTSDLSWFLSYCEIPSHLPISIACHNSERCWSSSPDKRTLKPYSDFPNLVVIYPQFPEAISFSKEKKFGIACHHPKLFVLQREDSIRVIITSANLVAKQWLRVTNTVWWQDFPRGNIPDYTSLFTRLNNEEINQNSKSDFASQLAGFMATLLIGAPDQSHWIMELTKFDFTNASGHLVASVPGIHAPKHPSISESLGSIEASVVGISYLYRTSSDLNGSLLKRLAIALQKCHVSTHGMMEVVLRKNVNIKADSNAVSVAVSESNKGGCIQIGFLPRDVAKWVAPLRDAGWFAFSGFVYPKQVLSCALEGSNNKVHLILYVYKGPNFVNISKMESTTILSSAMCSLVASVQRCSGLWRLHEILGHYKWPEHSETDFTFSASSVGSINAPFLAAFSAATGKRSLQLTETEESDPDWGCWSASQELRNPSIRLIFPTIERVKMSSSGLLASKYILCFTQKSWVRLKHLDILHDAVPSHVDRVGHPMHIKVARRRFQSRTNGPSTGWVYSGSHNLSAAAWGRPLQTSHDIRNKSVLGSRLHICNYEFGIVFIVPPSQTTTDPANLDDITLPFVVPAPKYTSTDTPATKLAMSNAYKELVREEREKIVEVVDVDVDVEEEMEEEEEEEQVLGIPDIVVEDKDDDKAYADKLWCS